MTISSAGQLRLTAIIPATDQPATLPSCLEAIKHAAAAPEQVLVISDASIRHASLARNTGAREATGDVLVFVDADVTVHPDAFSRIRQAFEADPGLAALFGSYDDTPGARGVVSVFRNLLHHHVHQQGAGPATTFWAGLGAIRREAFEAVDGFSVHPIEDIELGMRLSESGGRIRLEPAIQGTHLKRWTLWTMIRTDLLVRGIPWVGLLLDHRSSSSVLNLSWRHRLSALASVLLVAAAVLQLFWIALVLVAILVGLNWSFYRLLVRRMGLLRALGGVLLHWLHHLVGVVAVPLGIIRYLARGREPAVPRRA